MDMGGASGNAGDSWARRRVARDQKPDSREVLKAFTVQYDDVSKLVQVKNEQRAPRK